MGRMLGFPICILSALLLPHFPYSMNIRIIFQWFRRRNNNPDELWAPGPSSFLLLTNRSMSFCKTGSWRAAIWKFSIANYKWKFILLDKGSTVNVVFLHFSGPVATWPQLDVLAELNRRHNMNNERGKSLMMMISCAESRNRGLRGGY